MPGELNLKATKTVSKQRNTLNDGIGLDWLCSEADGRILCRKKPRSEIGIPGFVALRAISGNLMQIQTRKRARLTDCKKSNVTEKATNCIEL